MLKTGISIGSCCRRKTVLCPPKSSVLKLSTRRDSFATLAMTSSARRSFRRASECLQPFRLLPVQYHKWVRGFSGGAFLGGRCVIPRSGGLSRIRGTMAPIASSYLRGYQGKNLVCQTPRSLGGAWKRWALPPR